MCLWNSHNQNILSHHKFTGLDGHVMIIWVACYRWESSIKFLHSVPERSLSDREVWLVEVGPEGCIWDHFVKWVSHMTCVFLQISMSIQLGMPCVSARNVDLWEVLTALNKSGDNNWEPSQLWTQTSTTRQSKCSPLSHWHSQHLLHTNLMNLFSLSYTRTIRAYVPPNWF